MLLTILSFPRLLSSSQPTTSSPKSHIMSLFPFGIIPYQVVPPCSYPTSCSFNSFTYSLYSSISSPIDKVTTPKYHTKSRLTRYNGYTSQKYALKLHTNRILWNCWCGNIVNLFTFVRVNDTIGVGNYVSSTHVSNSFIHALQQM